MMEMDSDRIPILRNHFYDMKIWRKPGTVEYKVLKNPVRLIKKYTIYRLFNDATQEGPPTTMYKDKNIQIDLANDLQFFVKNCMYVLYM